VATSPAQAASLGELVLLTVPDDAIERVCTELAEAGAFRPGAVVAHCSGALASGVLAAARDRCACAIGSLHPLQTCPTAEAAAARLAGTHCFVEGEERAVAVLEDLARAIGGVPVRIAPAAKAMYHAAAVMACNYLVAIQDAAARMAAAAGVDRATWLAAAGPILRATVDNVLAMGPERAITGPITRGETGTLERHAAALVALPATVRDVYAALGRYTVDMALRAGRIDASTAEKLRRLLGP
jgi:predicted short-subunit dehydrogenase-like oxidoreductase (DUF2520 family)